MNYTFLKGLTHIHQNFFDANDCLSYDSESEKIRDELFDYFITYPSEEIAGMSYSDRIQWLCQYTTMHMRKKINSSKKIIEHKMNVLLILTQLILIDYCYATLHD